MGQNLNNELVATVQGQLGVAAPTNASGRTGDTTERQLGLRHRIAMLWATGNSEDGMLHGLHDGTGLERRALRAPGDQLCYVKNQVAKREESQREPSRNNRG